MKTNTFDASELEEYWGFMRNPFFKLNSSQYDSNERLEIFTLSSEMLNSIIKAEHSFLLGRKGTGKSMILQFLESYYLSKMFIDITINPCGKAEKIPIYINGTNLIKKENFEESFIWLIINKFEETYYNISNILTSPYWFEDTVLKPLKKYRLLIDKYFKEDFDLDSIEKAKDDIIECNNVGGSIQNFLENLYNLVSEANDLKHRKESISFLTIDILFKKHLSKFANKLELLVDEVSGFELKRYEVKNEHSDFSSIINSLRNQNYLYYKIAIESGTYAEKILLDTRYGVKIKLDYDISIPSEVKESRKVFSNMLSSYIKYSKNLSHYNVEDNFLLLDNDYYSSEIEIDDEKAFDCIEQFVIYSEGVIREFLDICSISMVSAAHKFNKGESHLLFVEVADIKMSAKQYGMAYVKDLGEEEKSKLYKIANKLRTSECCQFTYKSDVKDLEKMRSGSGSSFSVKPVLIRTKDIYGYSNCFKMPMVVYEYLDIPTHYIKGTNDHSHSKSIITSEMISGICEISKIDIDEYTNDLIEKLGNCEGGDKQWQEYENIVLEILNYVFCPPLLKGKPQSRTRTNYDRRDIIMENYDTSTGFWNYIRNNHDAKIIVFDCKNHKNGLDRSHITQIKEYLGNPLGKFGILIGRKIPEDTKRTDSERNHIEQARKQAFREHKVILMFDDSVLIDLIQKKSNNENVEDYVRNLYTKFMEEIEP